MHAAQEVILDVDTGIDDALAILFAIAHPDLHVRAISCVDGNVSVDKVVANTLKVLDLAGAPDVPVAAGAQRPLLEEPKNSSHVHGVDGLADLVIPRSARGISRLSASELMRDEILASPTPATIISLGPLTNSALLLRQFPQVRENLAGILFMGGSAGAGNATAVAEFNIWHDPEAAAIVLASDVPLTMYGLDVFSDVVIDEPTADALRASTEPRYRFIGDLLHHRIADEVYEPGIQAPYRGVLGDAGAVCALVDPEAIRWERRPVHVELFGESRGQTLVDRRAFRGEDQVHHQKAAWPLVDVALDIDGARYAALFLDSIGFEREL